MNIRIETIPHNAQNYDTVGDWRFDRKGNLIIRVSEMGNWKYEILVAVHELMEVALCKDRGISTEKVDRFDKAFEASRMAGNEDEPGDDPKSPYRNEHFFATSVERLFAAELKVDWKEYDKAVNAL